MGTLGTRSSQRRTARLVRACYAGYVAPGRVTAKQLYALCQLTWITKGGANQDGGLPDNTRAVVAPALRVLIGARLTDLDWSDMKPGVRARALLNDVGVRSLWFTTGMKAVKGLGARGSIR